MNMPRVSRQALDFIIDHVFLPPRLTQTDGTNAHHIDTTILVFRHCLTLHLSLGRPTCLAANGAGDAPEIPQLFETSPARVRKGRLCEIPSSLSDGGRCLVQK